MQLLLEKTLPAKRRQRFYTLSIYQALVGEWCLIYEWGRIGAAGGQKMVEYLGSESDAFAALETHHTGENNREYMTIPIQLKLFDEE